MRTLCPAPAKIRPCYHPQCVIEGGCFTSLERTTPGVGNALSQLLQNSISRRKGHLSPGSVVRKWGDILQQACQSRKESKCQLSHNDCYEKWDLKNERQNHACHVVGVPASKKTAEKGLKNLEKYHAKTGKVGEALTDKEVGQEFLFSGPTVCPSHICWLCLLLGLFLLSLYRVTKEADKQYWKIGKSWDSEEHLG
ncbi:uncharacterized protein [Pithys albifrons albifrons]|uniref:uncharacterized protein isoform X2 n=1 Tax=Pithys albifrons albifrons TaxID=3385563 RepID=UPI003A5D1519